MPLEESTWRALPLTENHEKTESVIRRVMRALSVGVLFAALALIDSGHTQARGHTVTLSYVEQQVLPPTLVHGKQQCLSMKHGMYYVNGKLQSGIECIGYAWHGTGYALVNGVKAEDRLSGDNYPLGADNCNSGTMSGHLTFAGGPDGIDYSAVFSICPTPGLINQPTAKIWFIVTQGYGRYLGASGLGSATSALSSGQNGTELATIKATWTITPAQ